MSDRSADTGGHGRLRSIAAAVMLAVGIGFSIAAFAVNASASPTAKDKAQCRINFSASSLHLRVGQDLVLTWTAIGADKLTASWTSGYIPFVGAVTTTMNRAGTFSYQITGTINGAYCGGAGVEVSFSGATPSHAATSTAANPQPTHNGGGNGGGTGAGNGGGGGTGNGGTGGGNGTTNGGGNGAGNGGGGSVNGAANGANNGGNGVAAGKANRAGKYPAQSPTSGTGVSWLQQPLNLLAIGGLALLMSLALWKRENIRAPFVHQH